MRLPRPLGLARPMHNNNYKLLLRGSPVGAQQISCRPRNGSLSRLSFVYKTADDLFDPHPLTACLMSRRDGLEDDSAQAMAAIQKFPAHSELM
jgi:hypothetical protein